MALHTHHAAQALRTGLGHATIAELQTLLASQQRRAAQLPKPAVRVRMPVFSAPAPGGAPPAL